MSNPKLIPVPFADDGTYTNISTNRGSGDALEQPNYSEGFPAITSTPLAAGGKAPRREDFNGLLHDLSENISHLNKGGFFMFDVDFCAQIGGYPKGSVLLSNDKTEKYTSLIDNNTSNFNVSVDPSKWVQSGLTETEVKTIVWGEKPTAASQEEMESGTEAQIRSVSPLRVAQAIAALSVSGIGYGQTWQNVADSRAFGVTYTNSTGKPIEVSVTAYGGSVAFQTTIGGVVIGKQYSTYNAGGPRHNMTFIVPNNTTYKVDYTGTLEYWTELR